MQHFRLRYRAHDMELSVGEFIVGRGEDCQLALDDALVSRRHALFRISPDRVVVADLGSRNGVLVNGDRILGERVLVDGDRVSIGKHDLLFSVVNANPHRNRGFLARTLGPVELQDLEDVVGAGGSVMPGEWEPDVKEAPPRSDSVSPGSSTTPQRSSSGVRRIIASFSTLASLADKALTLGRGDEAEKILSTPLQEFAKELRQGAPADSVVMGRFAVYALRLATSLSKATWVEWIFDAYGTAGLVIPGPIVDELVALIPKLKHLNRRALTGYLERLGGSRTLGPNDRFLLQRLDGLAKRHATLP
jgi:hypothetical protein